MTTLLTFLFNLVIARDREMRAFHDDSLRANQGQPAAVFAPWRTFFGA